MMRCFAAVELSDAARDQLAKLVREDLPRTREARWCTPGQLHVTLKFLGEFDERRTPEICEAMSAAAAFIKPFEMRVRGLGVFPSRRAPRVFWAGVEDLTQGCARWLDLADPLFEKVGFARENRMFHPHVTLGRAKTPAGERLLRRLATDVAWPESAAYLVKELVLFESRLNPRGALYTPVFRASLGG